MGVMNAMASGCVPLVVNKGEPPHLVEYPDQIWSTWDELVEKTRWWILNPERLSKRAKEMVANAKKYSDESFWFSTQKIFSKFGVKF
jgi:glycosyltransferase involved in cell wall biosynthesis